MKKSENEKYIGDILSETGKINETIEDRKRKAFGIVSDIVAILEEVPFGPYHIEAGLVMRNGMFVNGILTNAEIWHGATDKILETLEVVDEYLLRKILKAHSKTPKEALYLETGAIPIRCIVKK